MRISYDTSTFKYSHFSRAKSGWIHAPSLLEVVVHVPVSNSGIRLVSSGKQLPQKHSVRPLHGGKKNTDSLTALFITALYFFSGVSINYEALLSTCLFYKMTVRIGTLEHFDAAFLNFCHHQNSTFVCCKAVLESQDPPKQDF